ncbi:MULTISPECIES: sulfur oxidation c-type cytochrome SoxX [Thiomicrorhabdus]|uniref:Sulfur oxidation c-type cytochrome SoxX n=1 Tax=Thiomicrorhabdus heinhorstiae TaxID=2748010 RepID=A0ABS0BXU2_9GAMM|nr:MULTISPECIES: sulfur oxidation c-type cytochrome SoxX [Thiomicrorhabdus]MBF6058224.1 sulfur oxidation c-type cytochrome SoxX [Thiomicrorhabdus heinhorstiae]
MINQIRISGYLLAACASLTVTMAHAVDDSKDRGKSVSDAEFMQAVKESFLTENPNDFKRFQDPTLTTCNQTQDQPSPKQASEILQRERSSIQLPKNGQYMGDWKQGKIWVEGAHGGRIGFPGFADADHPSKPNGANCYACHAVDPNFPQNGNMGPSLTNYGKLRGQGAAIVKYTYEKIYNAKSFVPCSLMPRYGAGEGHLLTAEQVADITAFLLHPDSPVNNPKQETVAEAAHH